MILLSIVFEVELSEVTFHTFPFDNYNASEQPFTHVSETKSDGPRASGLASYLLSKGHFF